jgi:hypothetical protein
MNESCSVTLPSSPRQVPYMEFFSLFFEIVVDLILKQCTMQGDEVLLFDGKDK